MQTLQHKFQDREELVAYLRELAPWAEGDAAPSDFAGGSKKALARLKVLTLDKLADYAKTRNYANGSVSYLSSFLSHGLLSLKQVKDTLLKNCKNCLGKEEQASKFIQELAWRDFWQRVVRNHPEYLWQDIENYKTGFRAEEYSQQLPEDLLRAQTETACINQMITELLETGYLHNHARMYLASYVVHFRKVSWQAGARWFLKHLLDGDPASNNLSWQWISSTFSNKPYFFNLENVRKYFGGVLEVSPEKNQLLDASYQVLQKRLFPRL